jgi:hypothetical protein
VYIDELLEMPGNAFELLEHVAAQGRGYFDMMTAEIELHESSNA